MSFTELETLIDSRADLLARLTVLERDDVAELVAKKIESDISERDEQEARMVWDYQNVPARWESDFGA